MDIEKKQIAQEIRDAILDGESSHVISLLRGHPELRDFMSPFGTWLHVAGKHGRLDVVTFLVELGMDVNLRGGISGGAPIHLAASQGHVDVVRYLLSHGAEMDVSEPERNPLFGAIYGGHTDVAKILIDSGIDTQVRYTGPNMENMDALAFANEWGRKEIVDLFMKKK
jgi:uncharacterized protein